MATVHPSLFKEIKFQLCTANSDEERKTCSHYEHGYQIAELDGDGNLVRLAKPIQKEFCAHNQGEFCFYHKHKWEDYQQKNEKEA